MLQAFTSGYLQFTGEFGMTDRGFYLLLTFLLLALATCEVVYAMIGPLSASTYQVHEYSTISRAP